MLAPAILSEFDAIFASERKSIRIPGGGAADPDRPLTGLAFSGGGIRSATFNLGILQALSELKLLREFDYLSCVSGGGYIGGWLSAFIHRECDGKVEIAEDKLVTGGAEHSAIHFLRSYSNYLTPQTGLFSSDTLTAVATFVRNLYLNLTLVVLGLAGVLLLPRLLVGGVLYLFGLHGVVFPSGYVSLASIVGICCAILAMLFAGMNLGCRCTSPTPWYTQQKWVLTLIVIPGLLSAWLISYGFYASPQQPVTLELKYWALWVGAVYVVPWILGWGLGYLGGTSVAELWQALLKPGPWFCTLLFASFAGAFGIALMVAFTQIVATIPRDYCGVWIVTALATLLLIKFYSLTIIGHIGLMGRYFSHESREWWSRLGGWVLLFALSWSFLFLVVFLAPAFFRWAPQWFINSGALTWATATVAGVLMGRHPATSGQLRKKWLDIVAQVMPFIFIVGLLGLLSFGLHQLLLLMAWSPTGLKLFGGEWRGLSDPDDSSFMTWVAHEAEYFHAVPITLVFGLCMGCFVAAALLAWRFNVNLFSIYHFYRQRLTRCYLGASRCKVRTPHPFTGFDQQDDLKLAALCHEENNQIVCQRPYPIFNTAMNLVSGKQLAWQERLATAFSFTPLACGYCFILPDEKGQCLNAYRPSSEYMEGVWLGSAMSISGAAASPNMGYHSSPAVTFLMTVFNVRLGHWSPNPMHAKTWKQHDPVFGGTYLLKELFGLTDYTSSFVYLSDGGHFENLGVYELVRRRIATIVVVDAGQDEHSNYDDLGNAIRKCYADFGVVIDIHADALKTGYHAIGSIRYPRREGEPKPPPEGTLIYLKPALTGSVPVDLQNYALTHKGFPHQSTVDQCFDESQFESYRKLGHWIGREVFRISPEQMPADINALAHISAQMRKTGLAAASGVAA